MEKTYDVIVAGGGPAGVSAAVSSARQGAKTALVERYGILGGMLTSGHVQPILGFAEGRTMYDEMISLLGEGHESERIITRNGPEIGVDVEEAKYKLLKLAVDEGVDVYLQTPVADVIVENGVLCGIKVLTPEGIKVMTAKAFVDSTGDGFVAARCGCPFEIGREADGKCQPVTLEFTLSGIDEKYGFTCFGGSDPVTLPDGRRYSEVCKEACKNGILPENVSIVRIHKTLYKGERNINATQYNGCNTLDPKDSTKADLALREQIPVIIDFLKKNAPGFENCTLKSTGSTLGVRETRRFIGDYVISDTDVENGARFDDVVVHKAWFLIDIHNPTGGGQAEKHSQPATPYDIPYRSLLPKNVDGLLLSGRNISGTHRAHASYRVMGVALATGQAAGVAASLSAKYGCVPRRLDYKHVQAALMEYGAKLFD